jgi:HEAT repeat protein
MKLGKYILFTSLLVVGGFNLVVSQRTALTIGPTWAQQLAARGIDTTSAAQLRSILNDPASSLHFKVLSYASEHPFGELADDIALFLHHPEDTMLRLAAAIALLQLDDPRGVAALDSVIQWTGQRTQVNVRRKVEAIEAFARKGVYDYVDTLISSYFYIVSGGGINGDLISAMHLYAANPLYHDRILSAHMEAFPIASNLNKTGVLEFIYNLDSPVGDQFLMTVLRSDTSKVSRAVALMCLVERPSAELDAFAIQAVRSEQDTSLRRALNNYLRNKRSPFVVKTIEELLSSETDVYLLSVMNFYLKTFRPRVPAVSSPVVSLIDSLRFLKDTLFTYAWLGNESFASELDSNITLAGNKIAAGDSVSCAREIKKLQEKVVAAHDNPIAGVRFVTEEGYRFLYYNAQYLLDRLPVPPPTYGLAVSVIGSGSVTKTPEQAVYDSASTVQLTAIPGQDYVFAGWSGDVPMGQDSANPLSMLMNSNKTVMVAFAFNPQVHILSVPLQYATIQAAVNASRRKNVIEVNPGLYNELVIVSNKDSVTLRTTGGIDQVTVKGFRLSQSNVITIKGFIVDATSTTEHGIALMGGNNQSTDVTIEACEIKNAGNDQSGISIARGNPRTRIVNNRIHDNGRNGIVFIDATGGPHYVINNTIVRNGWNGVNVARQHVIYLVNNILSFNGTKSGSTGGRYGVLREAMTGPGEASGITLLNNLIVGNNGNVTSTSSKDIGNYAQTLDATDSGNFTTSGTEGPGVAAAPTIELADVFVSATDLHLKVGSFAVDRGLDSYAPPDASAGAIPAFDFEGEQRPRGAAVDLGADERE